VGIRYLRYKPRNTLLVHYDVGVDARWHHATAMISRRNLSKRARKLENVALAELVDGRSPAADPLFYEPALGALIQWLPLDLSLWALAVPPRQLDQRLRAAGVKLERPGEEPSLLAYKPRRRAVVQLERHVLKYYAARAAFGRGLTGLRRASALRSLRAPDFEASLPELLVTVQSHVDGRPCASPATAAGEAGSVLARLHATGLGGLREFPPAAQLGLAATSARLVAHIAPGLEPRLEALMGRLGATAPGALEPVASHGDFSARQLIDAAPGLVVTDFDSICAAPAALDHATYLAFLVRGDPSDLDRAADVMETLVEGYGERPEELSWYLATMVLRRAARPFRYQDEHWPERVEQMVAAAERVAE
jgi:hypothetical protein